MESFFVQMDYGFIFHKKCLPDLYTFPDKGQKGGI